MWSVLKLCSNVMDISRTPTNKWRRPIRNVSLVFSEKLLFVNKKKIFYFISVIEKKWMFCCMNIYLPGFHFVSRYIW